MSKIDLDLVYKYLCIKNNSGRILQYRNSGRFENYSHNAQYRIYSSITGETVRCYRQLVQEILSNAVVIDGNNVVEIICFENIESLAHGYLLDSIERKFNIRLEFTGNIVLINFDNNKHAYRFLLFLLCDLIDMTTIIGLNIPSCMLDECHNWYEEKHVLEYSYFNYIELSEEFNEVLPKLGYCINNLAIICEPYKSDIVIVSDIINDISNYQLIIGCRRKRLRKIKKDMYEILGTMQRYLAANNFVYCGQNINYIIEDNEFEYSLKILEIDRELRRYRYPHQYFSFVSCAGLYNGEVLVWQSGNDFDINIFAEKIRCILHAVYGGEVAVVKLVGERITFNFEDKEIASIWTVAQDVLMQNNVKQKRCVIAKMWGINV
ncbi:MAG: hypothetical protein R3Y32_00050 [Bacillota bacterium]